MNFHNLEYFLTAAEELNITRAAERLHISQQALSNHIQKMEKGLDIALFERTPTLQLTYAGKCLVRTGRQIMALRREFSAQIEELNQNIRGELRIGISHTRGQAILPRVLPLFHARHPLVELTLLEDNSRNLEEMLAHGQADLVFGFTPFLLDTVVETVPLMKERLFLIVHRRFMHQLYGERADYMRGKFSECADISMLEGLPMIALKRGDRVRTLMDLHLSQNQIRPQILLETANIQTAFSLACEGMGVTLCPELLLRCYCQEHDMSRYEVDFFPLQSGATTQTLVIGYSPDRFLSNAARDFIRLTREALEGML